MDRRKVRNIIEALSRHQDPDSINVLNEVGTNSAVDEVRDNARSVKALMALSC